MRKVKIVFMWAVLAFAFLNFREQGIVEQIESIRNEVKVYYEPPASETFVVFSDCFEYAELITGFSAEILRGIAATESNFRTGVIGDGGMSLGMFQLHSRWHESRVEKWGEFDPIDPFESAVIAAKIMQENLAAFGGDLRFAIGAYKQGIAGVRSNGVISWYVDEVFHWRENREKYLSFLLFCGITNIEELRDGYRSAGAQDMYKLANSSAVQVSWRRRGGVSQEEWQSRSLTWVKAQ